MDATLHCSTTQINSKIMNMRELFSLHGYDLDKMQDLSNVWLEPTMDSYVLNENNERELITKLYINGLADIVEIPLSDGTIIRCTPNHKFKLADGQWKHADELDVDDEINGF
jgi:hypothetical protein